MSGTAWQGNGMGAAWARHAMCVNRSLNVFFNPRLDLPCPFFVAWVVPKDAPKSGALYNINLLFLGRGVVSPSLNPRTEGPRLPAVHG